MVICAWRGAPNEGSVVVCGRRPGSVEVVVEGGVVVVGLGGALVVGEAA